MEGVYSYRQFTKEEEADDDMDCIKGKEHHHGFSFPGWNKQKKRDDYVGASKSNTQERGSSRLLKLIC